MSTAMRAQIEKIRTEIDQIKPRPFVECKLMGQPPDVATDEVKAVYQAELTAAKAAGVSVIELVGIKPGPPKRRWQKPADRESWL